MPEAPPYQRVLALIKLDRTDERIARKALLLARMSRAQLLFLHLIEPDAALDGGYPAAAASTGAAALEAGAVRRLEFMATQLGAGEAECIARSGPLRQTFRQVLQTWQPDLVVAAAEPDLPTGHCDVLILGQRNAPKRGRLTGRLAAWLNSSLRPAAI